MQSTMLATFERKQDADAEVEAVEPSAFAVEGPDPRLPGPDSHCPPLTPIRFAAAFEGA